MQAEFPPWMNWWKMLCFPSKCEYVLISLTTILDKIYIFSMFYNHLTLLYKSQTIILLQVNLRNWVSLSCIDSNSIWVDFHALGVVDLHWLLEYSPGKGLFGHFCQLPIVLNNLLNLQNFENGKVLPNPPHQFHHPNFWHVGRKLNILGSFDK